jgi:hypothetical protein
MRACRSAYLTAAAFFLFLPANARAESLRIATFDAGLSRKGPGLALNDLRKEDPQIEAAIAVIAQVNPDVILLTGVDYDAGHALLGALEQRLAKRGSPYGHIFATKPNTGMATGFDVDGNGRDYEARDAQGFGYFAGDNGMALLSRYPIEATRDFSAFLWKDLPDNLMTGAGISVQLAQVQRLSTTAHWDVTLRTARGPIHLLAYSATPPVFDGPEDRNGRRNHDETAFWTAYLDGRLPEKPIAAPFVILGNANLDPVEGDGRLDAIHDLLADPRITDPRQSSQGGSGQDTAEFDGDAGSLRVDYVLPSSELVVKGAAVYWPAPNDPMAEVAAQASRHRLVFVDIELP